MIHVMPIKSEETEPWLLRKHYARRMCVVQYAFGIYDNKNLIGIVTYGPPASPNICRGVCGVEWFSNVIELNRLCCKNDKNIASMLVGRSLQMLPKPSIVVSYADTAHGHIGYVYQSTNFIYTGMTDQDRKTPRFDRFTVDGKHPRHSGRTPEGKMDTTLVKVPRKPKHRYVYFVGDRRQKRQMMGVLNYPIQPYPKGESHRYDCSAPIETQSLLFEFGGM